MKAYWCEPSSGEGECTDLIFANSRNEARSVSLMWGEASEGCEYIEIRARRCPAADKYVGENMHTSPIWREIGGCGDYGEPRCDTCGLAPCWDMPGYKKEFGICPNCNQCGECGCTCGDGV